jgi:hypothetical protein
MSSRRKATDGNNQRPDRPTIRLGQSTLPPLRSLEEPLYVIPERNEPPPRKKPAAAATAQTVLKKQARKSARKKQARGL